MFCVLGRSLVGFRWEFDRILPWRVLYLISKLKLSFLYLIKLMNLMNNLIKTLITTIISCVGSEQCSDPIRADGRPKGSDAS